jgi:hypothetical protein
MSKKIIPALALAASALVPLVASADPANGGTEVLPNTTVGSLVFFDLSNISNKSNDVDVTPSGTGFDIKRGYLIADHQFNDVWSADLTTDLQYSSSTTAGSGGVTEVYIKKLYLQGKFSELFAVNIGSYTTPWAPFVETLYEYRWIEKTQTDRLGFANTADWGLNASGAATVQSGGGPGFSYSVSALDGAGYKNPSRSKYVDVEARAAILPIEGLTIAVGGYSGHLGQVTVANENYETNTATRVDVAAGYTIAGFNVGAEYFNARNYKTANAVTGAFGTSAVVAATATGKVASDEADGESVWASYAFAKQYSVFARYDSAKLSKDVVPGLKDTYWNVGVAYQPIANINVGLVYKNEKVVNGSTSVSGADANGSLTIGGTSITTSGQYSEVGIFTSWKF